MHIALLFYRKMQLDCIDSRSSWITLCFHVLDVCWMQNVAQSFNMAKNSNIAVSEETILEAGEHIATAHANARAYTKALSKARMPTPRLALTAS
jgi:hypothetical protein